MYLARMALLLGATPFTDILKFYAVMLLLSPLLLAIRLKYGFKPLVAFCLILHVLHFIFYPVPYYNGFAGSNIIFGFIYGATTDIAGPSVLHGITFVTCGMWMGKFIEGNMERYRLLDRQKPQVIYLLVFCCLLTLIGGLTYDGDYYHALGSMDFRNSNSYIYFAFGIAGAIITIDLAMRFTEWVGADRIKPYLFLGATSMFIFCWGNIFLYFTRSTGLTQQEAVLATLGSAAFNVGLAWAYDKGRGRIKKMDQSLPAVQVYEFVAKGYADRIAASILGAFSKLKTR